MKNKTYGVPYMGSKAKLVDYITDISIYKLNIKSAIDVFTGTTRVAQAFRQNGIRTVTADISQASKIYSSAFISQQSTLHLSKHINEMNNLPGYDGWFTKNYSGRGDVSAPRATGRFAQPKNTRKIDAARDYVETLTDISEIDRDTLVCSIMLATKHVDNTIGQQQSYLKEWCSRSNQNIVFKLPPVVPGPVGYHFVGDSLKLDFPQADLAYLDPPYTSTVPYHTYYHIWDSIALWDKPETAGLNNRRADRSRQQTGVEYDVMYENIPWYDNKNIDDITNNRAYQAFETMVSDRLQHIPHIMISYSNQSIVPKQSIITMLQKYGSVEIFEISHKRMVMGSLGHSTLGNKQIAINPNVLEYIFVLTRK